MKLFIFLILFITREEVEEKEVLLGGVRGLGGDGGDDVWRMNERLDILREKNKRIKELETELILAARY